MPLSRWNDDRLDDLARQVQVNTEAIKEHLKVREELIELRALVNTIGDDTRECRSDVRDLKTAREEDRKAETERDEQHRKERKADRKWFVLTMLTSVGLVVTALGLFLG